MLRPTADDAPVATLAPRSARSEARDQRTYENWSLHMSLDLESLETSFDLLAPKGEELMDDFYSRLFAAAPSARPLFPADLKRQKTMLLATLVLLRKSLRNLDDIAPTLRNLGARHVAYGARREHYPIVGAALIGSMAAIAGHEWKPDYERAWQAAFELVAATMLEGAEQAEVAAAA
jgi:hemoglobin-like flavoprotein